VAANSTSAGAPPSRKSSSVWPRPLPRPYPARWSMRRCSASISASTKARCATSSRWRHDRLRASRCDHRHVRLFRL